MGTGSVSRLSRSPSELRRPSNGIGFILFLGTLMLGQSLTCADDGWGHRRHSNNNEDFMGSNQRKKSPNTRSLSRHTKRKRANSAAKAKALMNKPEHVKTQAVQAPPRRTPRKASSTNKMASIMGPGTTSEALRSAANENLRPALLGPTQAMAFWSPLAVFLRQQTLWASMGLNVIWSQRLWVQAFRRAS